MKPHDKKRFKKPLKYKCKVCGGTFSSPHVKTKGDMIKYDGATMDCPHCGFIYMVKKGKLVDFNKELHKTCPEWPEDGKGTGYIELGKMAYSIVKQPKNGYALYGSITDNFVLLNASLEDIINFMIEEYRGHIREVMTQNMELVDSNSPIAKKWDEAIEFIEELHGEEEKENILRIVEENVSDEG